MAEYSVAFASSALRELEVIDATVIPRILSKIEPLAAHPRPHGSRKFTGEKHLWRIRIGDYRVISSISTKNDASTLPPCATDGKHTTKE